MQLIGDLGLQLGSGILGYVVPFLFVLTIVVFFHELGHFLVARWCGVKIDAFSIGFGPEVIGRNDRHGTRWRLSAIPLGGYVKFAGDENAASVPDRAAIAAMSDADRKTLFAAKPVWQRAAVVAAGPIANFILAIAIFAILLTLFGRPVTEARVDGLEPGGAAAAAGFEVGDVVVSIDGTAIKSFTDLQRMVADSPGEALTVVVRRAAGDATLSVTPRLQEMKDRFGNVQKVGVLGIRRDIASGQVTLQRYSFPEAVAEGASQTWYVISRTLEYVVHVFNGRESADQLGGTIRMAQISGQVAQDGIVALLNLAAVFSVSIGLLNLFPIPMLDGGHLVFYAFEAVLRRPLSARAQDVGFRIGLALVLALMVFATWNDIVHLTRQFSAS
ncbi:RIP metalloprotease RseP [Segnochrobactrum spirostomi]|uniref:Zinc metalloprotease n=1 Tax=Segnochrobactrum spirostomi TaxID=2608987 RepID=A0A6A7XZP9_9HYPH|nr:RIP metalloprotease RseP [Segnochrobactrum spirostomi]MQT12053.1 RIP metalloprotease RseP [Segnochrobactrum spirostomi]